MMAAVRKGPHYPVPLPPVPAPGRTGVLAALGLALLLAGCGREATRPETPQARHWPQVAPDDPASANAVTLRALSLVGTPYRYGGNTPAGGFDCSGLVGYVFREAAGLTLPRTSQAIADVKVPKVEHKRLRPGDLVFFGKRKVNHIGIYVGEGRFVHSPSTGKDVRVDSLVTGYWSGKFMQARRVAM